LSVPARTTPLSVIIPCYNEAGAVAATIAAVREAVSVIVDSEVIVVDDGSTDKTSAIIAEVCKTAHSSPVTRVITHDRNLGYGAALKSGIMSSSAEFIATTDSDGTYPNELIPTLFQACQAVDMVVGARSGTPVAGTRLRAIPKLFLRLWASWIAQRNIPDLNSGLRVFRREAALKYLPILPNKFSFTTTITLAMLTNHHAVSFLPITYSQRVGKSKIRPIQDTINFLTLILRTGVYFSPMRVFAPFALLCFILALGTLAYDIFVARNVGDTTILLFIFAFNIGMFALLADMIDKRSRF